MKSSIRIGIAFGSIAFGLGLLSMAFAPANAAQVSEITIPEVTITGNAHANVLELPEMVIAANEATPARKPVQKAPKASGMPRQVRFLDHGPAGRTVTFTPDDPIATAMIRKH